MSNVPKLRFSDFRGEWEEKRLDDIAKFYNSKRIPLTESDREKGIYPYYGASGIIDYVKDYIFDGEYILLGEDGANIVLRNSRLVFLAKGKFWLNNHAHIFQAKESNSFLCELLEKINYTKYNTGTAQPKLNAEVVKNIKVILPSKQEQEKIASFLTSVDKKIEQLTKKESLLQEYKKGLMSKIFNQEIRFKDDNGNKFPEWEEKNLNELMYEHKERNYEKKYTKNDVLSVSGSHGIVNQIEFQGRSFAGVSVDNYHIVKVDDIVYTKSPLKANPYGIIKTNKYKDGIVSTLYAVYRPKECLFPQYINYYFEIDDNVNKYLRPLVHKGAKNDMKINNQHVLSSYISIPEKKEQTKIANFLSSIDKKIELTTKELNSIKEFKKALLQQMFV